MSLLAPTNVYFIACHGGPADHLSTFKKNLSQSIEISGAGAALDKFKEYGIKVDFPFSIPKSSEEQEILAEKIARECSGAKIVITDVGDPFCVKIQEALKRLAPRVSRLAYYDNPEPYVPGGYSEVAANVMLAAQGILFSNSLLAKNPLYKKEGEEIDLGSRKKIGIGYYPMLKTEKIKELRTKEHASLRQALFSKNHLIDKGQKVLVYFGGNNTEYFSKAFPAFLSFLDEGADHFDFKDFLFVLQQHPGAKKENLDKSLLLTHSVKAPKIIVSDFSSDEAQILADGALYYQTSMGPQFLLAGIPVIQVGHKTYEDILIKNKLSPSVTDAAHLIQTLKSLTEPKEIPKEIILEGLGIQADWLQNLEKVLNEEDFI